MIRSRRHPGSSFFAYTLICAIGYQLLAAPAALAAAPGGIELTLTPKICTLSVEDDRCETTVRARWRSKRNESLCLVIVGHPQVRRCWDEFAEGRYSIELAFDQDLIVELRDPQLHDVLTSAAVTIIREALQFRRKRRQPWNLFY